MKSSAILVALLLTVLLHGEAINRDDLKEQGGNGPISPQMPLTLYAQLNFVAAMGVINQINSQNNTYTVSPNKFSLLSSDEKQKYFGLIPKSEQPMQASLAVVPPPSYQSNQARRTLYGAVANPKLGAIYISWRNETLSVRDQGACGSCWVFSALGVLEQMYLRVNKTRYPLSPQQMLSCNKAHFGCSGGLVEPCLDLAVSFGVTKESWYRYTAKDQACKTLATNAPLFKLKSWSYLKARDCQGMIAGLKMQMVSVAVAANDDFMYYSKGVLTKCGTAINHAVSLVGYVSNSTHDYYVVRNSWSAGWGEKGYIRISSTVQSGNLCGICQEQIIPNI